MSLEGGSRQVSAAEVRDVWSSHVGDSRAEICCVRAALCSSL